MNKQLARMLTVILLIVLCISAAVIYFTFDMRAIKYLSMFNPWSILMALGVLFIGLFFDATRLITLTDISGEHLDYKHVVNVVLSNYFLALLTPGQSGGAIAQLMFMRKAGVPVPKATVIILVRTIMSILFLFVIVPIIFYFEPALVGWMPPSVILLVCVAFVSIPVIIIYLMTTQYPEKWLTRLCTRFSENTQRAIFLWYRDFQQAAFLIGQNPLRIFKAFLESGLSLLFIYSVVPVFINGFGVQVPLNVVMGRMCLLNLVLYFTPTPGGTGVAEGGFLVLFGKLLPDGIVGVTAVLWRFFCEYIPFILGAIVTIRVFGADVITQIKSQRKID